MTDFSVLEIITIRCFVKEKNNKNCVHLCVYFYVRINYNKVT